VHVREQCPPPVPEPIVCPASQQISSDGLSCVPPCDGSYQDCIYNGHLCKAGSTEHACELPLEEGAEEAGLSCQPEDDFCKLGCESPSRDCIDDVSFGDDGEDSDLTGDEEEESGAEDEEEDSSGEEESRDDYYQLLSHVLISLNYLNKINISSCAISFKSNTTSVCNYSGAHREKMTVIWFLFNWK
jgi:hypothetical protein